MKTLILYYSYGGNTKRIAEMIQREIGGDIARLIGQNVCPFWGHRRRSMPLFQPFKSRARF